MEMKEKKFLTVAPFECAWRKDLKFREAGRGCVAFEAFAHNDVTLVFRENVGSQHYHYKRDNSPHYTVILGSHRNKRLKIEVDGKTVVDVAGVGLCCSSEFKSYWISICDGLISIGKGRYPFQNLVFQWLDSNPNCSVRYVGLSSWDKHVGYRNVNVLPITHNHISLWKHVESGELEGEEEGEDELNGECMDYEKWGLENFLENWELSDMVFIFDTEERHVPAHKAILVASGNFPFSLSEDVVELPAVTYPVLHAFLQYIYTGQTKVLCFLESPILNNILIYLHSLSAPNPPPPPTHPSFKIVVNASSLTHYKICFNNLHSYAYTYIHTYGLCFLLTSVFLLGKRSLNFVLCIFVTGKKT